MRQITDGLPRRCWVNQPSKHQPYNALHGTKVLAVHGFEQTARIYFLSGDIVSMQVPYLVLSEGWK